MKEGKSNIETATLGGGCFWCLEAVYQKVKGVTGVVSGYSGGDKINPTYKEVCDEITGHAEVVQIAYLNTVISYSDILRIFWVIHNPTTLNKQGADIGTQYRSIILYHDEKQKMIAEKSREEAQEHFVNRIVTQIEPLDIFYPAEDYHQNYFNQNPWNGYCQAVVAPKVLKFKEKFRDTFLEE